jgi:hypothetical protein
MRGLDSRIQSFRSVPNFLDGRVKPGHEVGILVRSAFPSHRVMF